MEEQEMALWRNYARTRDARLREELLALHMPFAVKIAKHHYSSHADLQLDDLKQLAYVGLIEAVDRFDPDGEASFTTFASFRIKGAILNGMEKASEKRAQLALRKRVIEQRTKSLNGEADSTFERLAQIAVGLAIGFMLDDAQGLYCAEEGEEDTNLKGCAFVDMQRDLIRGIELLSEQEQVVIRRHYFEGIEFADIATEMRVTKGRISQLHKSALARFRAVLGEGKRIDYAY